MTLKPELALIDVGAIDSISSLARETCLAGTTLNSGKSEAIFFEHRKESKIADPPTRLSRLSK